MRLCCNEHRGNKLIVPLFFIPNINDLIIYNKNGTIGISKIVKSSQRQIELSNYCCPLKLFIQNKLGLTLLTKYQPF